MATNQPIKDDLGPDNQLVGSLGFSYPGFAQELGLLEVVDAGSKGGEGGLRLPPVYDFTRLGPSSLRLGLRFWYAGHGRAESSIISENGANIVEELPSLNVSNFLTRFGRHPAVGNSRVLVNADYDQYAGNAFTDRPTKGTVSFWAYLDLCDDTGTGIEHSAFLFGSTSGSPDYIGFGFMPGGYPFVRWQHPDLPTDNFVSFGGSSFVRKGWIHVVIVADGSAWTCYINGVEQTPTIEIGANAGSFVGSLASDSTLYTIGDKNNPNGYRYGLSDLGVWDRILPLDEIRQLAFAPNSLYRSFRRVVLVDRYRLHPTGIASTNAFGTAKINQQIRPTGIASTNAFGAPQIQQQIRPTGIASTNAFGTPQIQQQIRVTGIASTSALGTPQVNLQIRATGIASTTALGTPTVVANQFVSPIGIPSGNAFGVSKVNLQVRVSGIPSGNAFGVSKVNLQVRATGIASTSALGAPQVNLQVRVTGIPSGNAFGTAKVNQQIRVAGIPSANAFGTPVIAGSLTIVVAGIASANALGVPQIKLQVRPAGIASTNALGTPQVNLQVRVTGIPSGNAFGAALVSIVGAAIHVAISSFARVGVVDSEAHAGVMFDNNATAGEVGSDQAQHGGLDSISAAGTLNTKTKL